MSLFFVRGVRHLAGTTEAVDRLHDGQVLAIMDDPDNVVNARALLLAGQDRNECPRGGCRINSSSSSTS